MSAISYIDPYIDPAIGHDLAVGESNRAIAAALKVSEETVKTYVASVLSKLQMENRPRAAVQALKRGLVSIENLSQISA